MSAAAAKTPDRIGPRTRPDGSKTCVGCPSLSVEWWEDVIGGELYAGQGGECLSAPYGDDEHQRIEPYWSDDTPVPDWCPAETGKP